LSARSFTVMPSASVIVRVIGGGAAGCGADIGAEGRSRRGCVGRGAGGRICPAGGRGWPNGGRCPGCDGMPGAPAAAWSACEPAAREAAVVRQAGLVSSDEAVHTAHAAVPLCPDATRPARLYLQQADRFLR
jgi:hypothetical protein